MEHVLYILTGDSGSGKTTWLTYYCKQVKAAGKSLSGVLAPGVWEDGEKIAIDNILLPQGQKICLANRKAESSSELIKKWDFSDDAMDEVNRHFENLLRADYLIIDELGPLELIENKGLKNTMKKLIDLDFNKAIVVIRPSLLDVAKQKFSNVAHLKILDIKDLNGKELPLL